MSTIKIVSDGTPNNTHVYNKDGTEISGIKSIQFLEINNNSLVEAIITFECCELDIALPEASVFSRKEQ